MAITGEVGAIYVSKIEVPPQVFTDKPTTADALKKRYQITDSAYRYWSPEEAITVKVDGQTVTSGFTLEYVGGFVEFTSPLDEEEVTVSGSALTLTQAGGFFNWTVDGDAETLDATTFDVDNPADRGWKRFIQGLKNWSGSAEAFWGDTRFFDSLGKLLVVKLFVDSGPSLKCLEGFAVISSDGIEVDVGGIVQHTIDFTGSGNLYVRF